MFNGSTVALVTPFDNGKLDEKSYADLIEFHIENGTDTILPCGTTGESATVTHEEQQYIFKFACETANKRIKILAGAGSNSTKEAVSLTKAAKEIGVDGILSITPYYNKPTQAGMIKHFTEAAKAAQDTPVVLYNVPGRTGISIAPETVAELSKIDNIIAIKEASGCLEQVNSIISLCDITVLSGDDSLTLPMLALGAKGVVSVAANIVPKQISDMVKAFEAGDLEVAKKLHFKLLPIFRNVFIETNPIPAKTALHMMGEIKKEFRLPLCDLKPENEKVIREMLQDFELI